MKPPMRSDAGPEAWVLYDEQNAKENFKEHCIKNNLFEHLPFLFNPEPKSNALMVLDKGRGLIVIPKSQVTSSVATTLDVSKRPKKKRRNNMEKNKKQEEKVVVTPVVEEGNFTNDSKRMIVVLLAGLLLGAYAWNYFRCNDCSKKEVVTQTKTNETTAKAKPKAPPAVLAEVTGHQKLVLVNQTNRPIQVGWVFNGRVSSHELAAGQTSPEINTREYMLTVKIEKKKHDIPLKKGRVTKFAIQG